MRWSKKYNICLGAWQQQFVGCVQGWGGVTLRMYSDTTDYLLKKVVINIIQESQNWFNVIVQTSVSFWFF